MDTNKWLMPASIVLAGLFIAGAVIWNNIHPASVGARPAGAPQAGGTIPAPETAGRPYVGNADAPVVIAFWADYQCPFCKKFEQETFPPIMRDYVQTGKAKVVFYEFPFLGSDSTDAARYSQAIWKLYPDRYLDWRTAMYAAQDAENGGFGDAASIDKLDAKIPGLDAAKITADVKANQAAYDAAIAADRAEGQKAGVNATPSFVIGGALVQGAVPYQQFQAVLDAALAR